MTTPEVKLRTTLDIDDIKVKVNDLASIIQTQIGTAFKNAFNQAGSVAQLSTTLSQLSNAANKLASTINNSSQALTNLGNAVNQVSGKTKNAATSFQKFFIGALKGSNQSQRFTQQLLKQVSAYGITDSALRELVESSNQYTVAQIQLANRLAQTRNDLQTLSKALKQGKATTDDVSDAILELIETERKLSLELQKQQKAIKQSQTAQKKSIELTNQLDRARRGAFTSSLQAISTEQKLTLGLLKQASAAGINLNELRTLAVATDQFTAEEIQAAFAVARLTGELEEQARTFDGTKAAENELIVTTQRLAKEQKNLADIQDKLRPDSGASGQEKFFTNLQVGFAKLNNVTAGIRNIIDIVDQTLFRLFRTAKEGAVITQTANSFETFATNIAGIPDLLDQLDDAAKGTISTLELQGQTLTLVAGLGPELSKTFSQALVGAGGFETSLLDVARSAQILNPALGDVDFFLKSLSVGIKRNERRWIDNLGIVISAREAYQRFAEANNKSVLELTATDKQLATLNETLRVGQLLIDQTSGSVENLIDPFSRLEAQVANLTDDFKALVAEGVLPYVELISGTLNLGIANQVESQLDRADDRFRESEEVIRRALEQDIDETELFALGPLSLLSITGAATVGGLISNAVTEAQQDAISIALRDLALESERGLQFSRSLTVAFEGDPDSRRKSLNRELRALRGELGDDALLEEGIEFDIFGNVATDNVALLEQAFFSLINAQNTATEGSSENAEALKQQSQRFRELKVAIDDVAQEFAQEQVNIAQSIFGPGLEDAERQQFGRQLAESFRDQFVEGLRASGLSEASLTAIRTFLGEFEEGALEASLATQDLNNEIADLTFLITRRGVTDAAIISNAFTALELGFAGSAVEALGLARNVQFVTNVLEPARDAALATADSLDEVTASTEDASEAIAELRSNLQDISDSGFDRARDAIASIAEATEGIAESSGERRTVQIDNTARIEEIETELFADLPEDRREELSDRLTELREDGQEFSDEYALILKEISSDISQSERDTLLVERFDLQQRQGEFLTAVFGRDPEALEGFEEQQQEAIQELIENRRRTIAELLTDGREVDFETEIGLLVGLELIGDLEADLLVTERRIFDAIDQIFGAESVFQVGNLIVDFGEILVNELPPDQISGLITAIETAVNDGVSQAAIQEAIDVAIKLNLAGEIDTDDFSAVVAGALEALAGDTELTGEEAVLIEVIPDLEGNLEGLDSLQSRIKKGLEGGEEFAQPVIDSVNKAKKAIDRVNEAIQVTEDNDEVEVTIIADTDEAVAAINSFLDIIPDEVKINITTDGAEDFRTPESGDIEGAGNVAPSSGADAENVNTFRQGGFTGSGNPNSPAGVVEFQEFVFNQQDVQSLGVGSLQSLRDGQASIVPTGPFSPDVVSSMLSAISNPVPTLAPAPITTNNTTNRTVSMDQSTTIVNNYFDKPRAGVSPVMDVIF